MSNTYPARRRFLGQAALLGAGALAPQAGRAQPRPVRIGVLHPVTGALAYSGTQCRAGALLAIADINAAGGIKSLGGAKLEAVLGDAQSQPEIGAAEVEKMNEAGVSAVVGAYASAICLATTQAAARHGLAHVVDVGVADAIVERGLTNTFRFGPGYKVATETAMSNLRTLNQLSGNRARTAMIVHEESLFGSGTARLLSQRLPEFGFEVKEVVKHANPARDFSNIVLRMKAANPDIVIAANYYNEYALLMRAMQQQKFRPKAVYSVLGGAASSFKFVKEFPTAAQHVLDCNHWYNPRDPRALALRKRVEASGLFFTYEVFCTYAATMLLADSMERAKSAQRERVIEACAGSSFSNHFMPYGPTRFVNGQNIGAQPLLTQVVDGDIKVVFPNAYRQVDAVFPLPAA
ncbi:ABC-type transporter, periplasmic component: HAAT family [Cupriavidus oxalaticus]|uniref:ABC transporter substrate-binding protein n=1 Tax=Cupriavidus oxalaticus TaxID=96344 RepID=UPI003F7328A6